MTVTVDTVQPPMGDAGAPIEQGGRGGLPVTLRRPLLAPQPEGGSR